MDNTNNMNNEVGAFRIKEAARYLGIGKTKLYELIDQGKIKTSFLSTRCRVIRKEVLDEFLLSTEEQKEKNYV